MSRVGELLDREIRIVDLAPGGYERLLRRRERKQRTRRISAALFAFVVLASTAAIIARSFVSGPLPTDSPPTHGALAYFADGDLYVADWDGSNPVPITNRAASDDCGKPAYFAEGPIWSPDGRHLAYRRACRDEVWWDVMISDAAGNPVASFPSEGWLISWSPDSQRVATWTRWGETIGIFGVDGELQATLTLPPGLMAPGDFDPVWSPDGESLVVPNGVEIPLDGSTPRQLPTEDPRSHRDATYSPDGSRVAYTTGNGALVVATADGSGAQRLVEPMVMSPAWSPDGELIAFAYAQADDRPSYAQLRVLDVDTGVVTELPGTGSVGTDWHIEFSPEGDRILYAVNEGSSLWSIGPDGSQPRRLVIGVARADWQPVDTKP